MFICPLLTQLVIQWYCGLEQEQIRSHEQILADHISYEEAHQNCSTWCLDTEARLKPLIGTDGDCAALERRLVCLNELIGQCDKEQDCLLLVRKCAVHVMSSSSSTGCDTISSSLLELDAFWDMINKKMTSTRDQLVTALKLRSDRDKLVRRLEEDLDRVECKKLQLDSFQSTLAEKCVQLGDAKVSMSSNSRVCRSVICISILAFWIS